MTTSSTDALCEAVLELNTRWNAWHEGWKWNEQDVAEQLDLCRRLATIKQQEQFEAELALDACIDIFSDFTEADIKFEARSFRNAWYIGKRNHET